MPQASDSLRTEMRKRFGSIDTIGPHEFMKGAGYRLTNDFQWVPKVGVGDLKDMSREEFDCLLFLVHEWDFGSLVLNDKPTGAETDSVGMEAAGRNEPIPTPKTEEKRE